MRTTTPVNLAPWPEPLPYHVWVDRTTRYEVDGDDGLRLELHLRDPDSGECYPIPAGEIALLSDPQPDLLVEDGRLLRGATWREIQGVEGSSWLRLDATNEINGCELEPSLVMGVLGAEGLAHRLVLPDNSLFTPFDLTLGTDFYEAYDDAGNWLPGEHHIDLYTGAHYRLYLRPRRWRYVATVRCLFFYASWFDAFYSYEIFTRAHFDRPPYFPSRHDLIHTRDLEVIPDYLGELRAYDAGIDWQWSHSRSAGYLRTEIFAAQYAALCYAYTLVGASDASVAVWRAAPRAGEYVLGIGRVDLDGSESRVWIRQRVDDADRWPLTLLGTYVVPFAVDAS